MTKKKFGVINPIIVTDDGPIVTIERAGRKVKLPKEDIKAVRAERRAFRGHCLVIETHNKPIYLKQSEGAVNDAMKYLHELAQ
jgi:hypothetical protein